MTLPQIITDLTSPLAILIGATILALVVRPWLLAHQTQVDATIDSIQDNQVRMKAEQLVRWLETDPAQAGKSGLEQRSTGITTLAGLFGISEPTAAIAIDAAYHGLLLAGQITTALKPAVTSASPEGMMTPASDDLPPGLPPQPPLSNGTAGDTDAEAGATIGG